MHIIRQICILHIIRQTGIRRVGKYYVVLDRQCIGNRDRSVSVYCIGKCKTKIIKSIISLPLAFLDPILGSGLRKIFLRLRQSDE